MMFAFVGFFFRLFNSGSEYSLYIATNWCPFSFLIDRFLCQLSLFFFFAISWLKKLGHLLCSFPSSRSCYSFAHILKYSSAPHIFCKLVVRFSGLIRIVCYFWWEYSTMTVPFFFICSHQIGLPQLHGICLEDGFSEHLKIEWLQTPNYSKRIFKKWLH